MAYKIFMTIDAAEELEKIIQYLIEKKRNPQAATSLLNDFENTKIRYTESKINCLQGYRFCEILINKRSRYGRNAVSGFFLIL